MPIIRAENLEKYIVTSSYPNIYSQYMNCEWRIQGPVGKKVQITFPEFKIDNCQQAGIKVYDGTATTGNFEVEHCGDEKPTTFVSTSNLVTLQVTFIMLLLYQRLT